MKLFAQHGKLAAMPDEAKTARADKSPGNYAKNLLASIASTAIALAVIFYGWHLQTVEYYEGRLISHCAAAHDEDGNFYLFTRGATDCGATKKLVR